MIPFILMLIHDNKYLIFYAKDSKKMKTLFCFGFYLVVSHGPDLRQPSLLLVKPKPT